METHRETLVNSVLERENKLLREQLDKAEVEKGKLLGIVERQTLILEDKRTKEESSLKSDRWLVYGLAIAVSLVTSATAYAIWRLWQMSQS